MEASIGIAVYPEDGEEGLALIRHADLAMYDAKKSAGHPIRRYLPIAKGIPPEREASSAHVIISGKHRQQNSRDPESRTG